MPGSYSVPQESARAVVLCPASSPLLRLVLRKIKKTTTLYYTNRFTDGDKQRALFFPGFFHFLQRVVYSDRACKVETATGSQKMLLASCLKHLVTSAAISVTKHHLSNYVLPASLSAVVTQGRVEAVLQAKHPISLLLAARIDTASHLLPPSDPSTWRTPFVLMEK